MSVNKVILIGNLGRDPEMRSTAGGGQVANLNIATTERRKDRDGNWTDHTEWHRVVAFGKTAENVGRFLKKGRQVYIEGKLSTSKYKDKDGVEKWSTQIIADVVQFLGGKDGGGGTTSGGSGTQRTLAPSKVNEPAHDTGFGFDDDIPF